MQASPISTMRAGLYVEQITGVGLTQIEDVLGVSLEGQRQTLRDGQAQAEALAQAVREAITRARDAGRDSFAPDDSTALQVSGLSSAQLRTLFAAVIGHPYSAASQAADQALYPGLPDHDALSLWQWSQAVEALEVRAARQGSMLPPGEGGGLRHALGQWYVNGERYTLAELFVTVRMGNLTQIDKALESDLNTMLANTNLARSLLAVLADMKRQRDLLATSQAPNAPQFLAKEHFADFVKKAGLSVADINKYGRQFKGDSSYLNRFSFTAGSSTTPDLCLYVPDPQNDPNTKVPTVALADYGYAMDELQALFDSVNAENQVKRLKVQTTQNSRMAVLEGMSSFMNSNAQQNQMVGRNL